VRWNRFRLVPPLLACALCLGGCGAGLNVGGGNGTVGGIVSGLASGASVTLSDGASSLPLAANGAFAFADTLTDGSTYVATVTTQPAGQTCVLGNATGTVVAGLLAVVTVTCS
jgi:hypothetical protein